MTVLCWQKIEEEVQEAARKRGARSLVTREEPRRNLAICCFVIGNVVAVDLDRN